MGKNKPSKNQKTKKTEKKFKKDDPKKAFSKFNKGNGPKNNLKSPTKAASDEQVKSNRSKPSSLQTKSIVAKDASLTNQKGLSSLQMKFAKKLEGSRFRSINENLYTTRGDDAFLKFQKDPDSFEIYHQGFRVGEDKEFVVVNEACVVPFIYKFWNYILPGTSFSMVGQPTGWHYQLDQTASQQSRFRPIP